MSKREKLVRAIIFLRIAALFLIVSFILKGSIKLSTFTFLLLEFSILSLGIYNFRISSRSGKIFPDFYLNLILFLLFIGLASLFLGHMPFAIFCFSLAIPLAIVIFGPYALHLCIKNLLSPQKVPKDKVIWYIILIYVFFAILIIDIFNGLYSSFFPLFCQDCKIINILENNPANSWDIFYYSAATFYSLTPTDLVPQGTALKITTIFEVVISYLIHIIVLVYSIGLLNSSNKNTA